MLSTRRCDRPPSSLSQLIFELDLLPDLHEAAERRPIIASFERRFRVDLNLGEDDVHCSRHDLNRDGEPVERVDGLERQQGQEDPDGEANNALARDGEDLNGVGGETFTSVNEAVELAAYGVVRELVGEDEFADRIGESVAMSFNPSLLGVCLICAYFSRRSSCVSLVLSDKLVARPCFAGGSPGEIDTGQSLVSDSSTHPTTSTYCSTYSQRLLLISSEKRKSRSPMFRAAIMMVAS